MRGLTRAESSLGGARGVLLLGALSMFAPLSTDFYLPALPSTTHDLGASASAVQLTLTASLLGLGAGQLLAGPLSDALGRRRPLLVGLALYTMTSVLCAVSPDVWVLVVLRLFQGAAGAAGIVIARAIVRDLHGGNEAARLFARLIIVTGLAPILAPVLGGQLLHVTDWRGLFVMLGGIGAALWLATWGLLHETLPPAARHEGGLTATVRVFRRLATDDAFMGYTLCFGLFFGAVFAYISSSPFIFQEIFGLSPQLFGALFAANAAAMVTTSQFGRRLLTRIGAGTLLAVGLGTGLAAGLAVLVVTLCHAGPIPVFACLFVLMASYGLVAPNAAALALEDHPDVAGSASAMMGLSQFGIGAGVAPLVGVAGTHTAIPAAIVIGVSVVAAIATRSLLAGGARGRPATCAAAGDAR